MDDIVEKVKKELEEIGFCDIKFTEKEDTLIRVTSSVKEQEFVERLK